MTTKTPKITKGSHLTVTTWPDGRTELKWDWDALIRDVREAIASVEGKKNLGDLVAETEVKVKKMRTKKTVAKKTKVE